MFLTTFLLTPFAFLVSPTSTEIKEYIFDFNPTNSLITNKILSSLKSSQTSFFLCICNQFHTSNICLNQEY